MSMDRLLMHVALVDQVTKPLQGITQTMQNSVDLGKQGMQEAAHGGAGLVAAGLAIQNALMPAIEMDRKLGEVKSLGVADEALQQLQATALDFAAEYGKSATEFVGASYDIQSAIAGLNGDELSQFTKASGVLAAATKADTGTITNYMGTMYGIFKNQANEMGKGEWVEQVAGMTASAVQMFKTTGSEMSSAFTSVGANATSAGIAMSEQMAILGTLQSTMSGSEAGTKYKSFLAGVAGAQDKLGLSFVDSQGQMLPMLDILDKIQGKFGDTLDVAEGDALKKAFGSEEAVSMIKLLMADTNGLAASMEQLGKIKGMDKAEEMAAAMTDQWERLNGSWFAVRAAVFGAVLPAINSIVGAMANGFTTLTGWVQEFPLLGEVLGVVAIGALSLGGVVSVLSLAMGAAKMMSAGWAVTLAAIQAPLKLMRLLVLDAATGTWVLNTALLANPITWIVLGVVALIAAVAAMIYYWDDLKASFGDMAVFKMLAKTIDWVIDKLNMIPGIDIEWRAGDQPEMAELAATAAMAPEVSGLAATGEMEPIAGGSIAEYKKPQNAPTMPPGMVHNMTTTNKTQGSSYKTYGDIHINQQEAITPAQLAEWEERNAG